MYDFSRFLVLFVSVFILFLSGMAMFLEKIAKLQGMECLMMYLNLKVTLCPLIEGLVPRAGFGTVTMFWIDIRCCDFISPYVT